MIMAHIRSIGSLFRGYSSHTNNQNNVLNDRDVVKKGILLKQKNMKERFFVLRRETSEDLPARLEYYDSEKKFQDGCPPKKKYILKDCFNISKKIDRNYCVIALYINKDCVGLITQNEEELRDWLHDLQSHKNSGIGHVGTLKIEYEHVWQVEVLPRSLGSTKQLIGHHWLCLTNRFLSLVRVENFKCKKDFSLSTIKKCGFLDQFFFFVLGQYSGVGCGELYMQTEDSFIAQNIHNNVSSAMNNFRRTSSLTESEMKGMMSSEQQDFPCGSRNRCNTVPNDRRNHHIAPNFPHDRLPQPHSDDCLDERIISHCCKGDIRCQTNDKDFFCEQEQDEYVKMESVPAPAGGERHHPNTLGISPRIIPVSPVGGPSHPIGTSTPNSPPIWGSAHSRNASFAENAYVPMQSPASPYLPMAPGGAPPGGTERRRTVSTPTPIPITPSDEESYEIFPNSETSSCTSGTPSDQRIQELGGGDERGQGPHSGGWGGSPHFAGGDDTDSFGAGPRSARTCSVGSKPDQFKRKNRLEPAAAAVGLADPARVRAFSVGSRVSVRLGVGRQGASGGAAPQGADGLGEMFPSIKESGNQAKNKSSSAPMLGAAPVSHSWSGTTGSYFRGFRNAPREMNLMMLDFSKNRSCDVIPSEDRDKDKDKEKDRRTSKERLWHTLTGCRHRTSSKSSGGSSNPRLGADKDPKGVEIPSLSGERCDYLELDFTPSPRGNNDAMRGYLPMHPPFVSSSLTCGGEFASERRGPRTCSLNDSYVDMAPSMTSSQDGYVDMTQGGSSGALALATSSTSSSSSSVNSGCAPAGGRTRRTSNIVPPVVAPPDLPSPLEDVEVEEEVARKKAGKKRSLREGGKRSESGGESPPEAPHKVKSGGGPLATLTNLIVRKNSSSGPARGGGGPLSPKGSPLPPKSGGKDSSPFSSLRRTKSREKESAPAPAGDTSPLRRRSTDSPSPPHGLSHRGEKMLLSPMEAGRLLREADERPYANMDAAPGGSLPSLAPRGGAPSPVPPSLEPPRPSYVNMQPGISSPELSPKDESSPRGPEQGYVMMGGGRGRPAPAKGVARRPEIPAPLLSSHSHGASEKAPPTERSRSHSGPGAPSILETPSKGGRGAASACSSPASYSPPTSPTLGSTSSVSSLSEGGLSSASSTCTVVNVGLKTTVPRGAAPTQSEPPSATEVKSPEGKEDETLNYVDLDLGKGKGGAKGAPPPSPKASKKVEGGTSAAPPSGGEDQEAPLSYVEIDFKKSEGLRNTSIARDADRHQ